MIASFMVALFPGCGVVTMPDLAPDGMTDDGASDAVTSDAGATTNDAMDSAIVSRCPVPPDFALSWGTPVKIPSSTAERQYAPSVSCDDKELYLHRFVSNDYNIYTARRSTPAAPWSEAVAIGVDAGSERDPEIGPEFLERTELYYTRDQSIHVATRSAPDMPWDEVGELFGGSSPALTGDGLTLYYIHAYQLQRRHRASPDEPWSEPEQISMPFQYQQVAASADGSVLLVSLPVQSAAPPVQVWRITNEWLAVPELDSMKSCDFTWQGDLLCSDSYDLFYVPNRQQ